MYCGLFWALSVIVTLPDFEPFDVGMKVTLIVQFFPGASVLLFEHPPGTIAKLPLIVRPERMSDVVPVLVSVTFLAELVAPVF